MILKIWTERVVLKDTYVLWSLDIKNQEVYTGKTLTGGDVPVGVPVLTNGTKLKPVAATAVRTPHDPLSVT